MAKGGYVYIMSNKSRTVLYVGVTSNLDARSMEHKQGLGSAFTRKYKCYDLMYYEAFGLIEEAIHREKRLKKYTRSKKIELIKRDNPEMRDLTEDVTGFD